jgi:hypothetical protein
VDSGTTHLGRLMSLPLLAGLLVAVSALVVLVWAPRPASAANEVRGNSAAAHAAHNKGNENSPSSTATFTSFGRFQAMGFPGIGSPITLPALPGMTTTTTVPKKCKSDTCAKTTAPKTPSTTTATTVPPVVTGTGFAGGSQSSGGSFTTFTSHSTPAASQKPAKPKSKPLVPVPEASGVFNEPMILADGGWKGISLQAATNLKVPLLFGLAVALFVLIQALIDRRDPKLSRAPERGQDDSIGFG